MSFSPAAQRWSAILDDYDPSGLTQCDFAKQRGLHPSTLASWRSKLKRSSTQAQVPPRFTEWVPPSQPASHCALLIRLPQRDAELVITTNTDLSLLRHTLDALC